jgi:cytochrome c biogenesis protein CcdA
VAEEATAERPEIHMAYFAEVGCSECDRVSIALGHLQNQFPNLVIHEMDIFRDLSINLCLSERLDVLEEQRHDAPAVFVGSGYLVDRDIQYERLVELVSWYAATGAAATWETCPPEVRLPPPPPGWTVIVPGLIDGINPCAFATIVFFVSYLTLLERKGREILLVGLSFTLAVFLSYLAFGMLLREVFAGLVGLVGPVLRPILNLTIALFCLVLAVLSLADYRKARRGQVKDMALRLPDRLRRWVNAAVRRSMNAARFQRGAFVLASFVAGVVVSFIELACTGQVYVPIIQGLSNPAYRAQSTLALIVYCLAFIVPLVAVFVAAYTGTNSRQLGLVLQRHTATVKLATAVLFLGIGLWLTYDVLRIWGVIAL